MLSKINKLSISTSLLTCSLDFTACDLKVLRVTQGNVMCIRDAVLLVIVTLNILKIGLFAIIFVCIFYLDVDIFSFYQSIIIFSN